MKKQEKTESALYATIRNQMAREGSLFRLENVIIPGLPDCIFIYRQRTIFIENKVCHVGKITMPIFQRTKAIEMKRDIHPYCHWYFVYEHTGLDDIIAAYLCGEVLRQPTSFNEKSKTASIDIRTALPVIMFYTAGELEDWLAVVCAKVSV